jgi:hypothetical protein
VGDPPVSAVPVKPGARDRTQEVIMAYESEFVAPGSTGGAGGWTMPPVAGVSGAEYDPANTRTSWEDGRWVG